MLFHYYYIIISSFFFLLDEIVVVVLLLLFITIIKYSCQLPMVEAVTIARACHGGDCSGLTRASG